MRAMGGYSWDENRADAQRLADMLWLLWSCPVPVVGRIQGDCYAGGVGLAAVCDVVVASDAAGFCLSEARLGLLPATIGPYVLRAIGASQARRWFVTAERFDAVTARALGLVHELVPAAGGEAALAAALDEAVQRIVQAVVDNGPQAVRACKQLVRDLTGEPIDHRLREDTARRIADIRSGAEGREGVAAFLERRQPAWREESA
jgi:methylglutaconyl-CoA hydratase